MLTNIVTQNCSVRDVTEHLKRCGVIVKPKIGRCSLYVWLDPKKVIKNEKTVDFLKEYGEKSKLFFVPKEIEKALNCVSVGLRQQIKELSLGDGFMPIGRVEKAVKVFEEKRRDYFSILNKITGSYDNYISTFKHKLNSSVEDYELIKEIMGNIPSVNEISSSFYMDLDVQVLNGENQDLDFIDNAEIVDEIKKGEERRVKALVEDIYGNLLQSLFNSIKNGINKSVELGYLHGKIINKIQKDVKELNKNNYFSNNDVAEFVKEFKLTQSEESVEELEDMLIATYKLAKDLILTHFIDLKDSPLTKEELEIMATS